MALDSTIPIRDWSEDLVLRALQDLDEPVGGLIRAFPGRQHLSDHTDWVDAWFLDLAKRFATGKAPDPVNIVASAAKSGELSQLAKSPVESRVRLSSLQPRFFRGFRDEETPISLEADLVVIEGRNSSGKTSLSEAIEWVLTGALSRRTSGQYGNARELADCIANEFKPTDEHTSVELRLKVDDQPLVLKRILRKDYSSTASDEPESEFFVDGEVCTKHDEILLRERIFAGVHPILMQHNLRSFVHDDPTSRRQYFERLLQIDELTSLIEKAVIGPAGLKQIPNPAGGTGLAALTALLAELEDGGTASGLKKVDRLAPDQVPASLSQALITCAKASFPSLLLNGETLGQCRERVTEAQRAQRETQLPLLSNLERARQAPPPSAVSLDREVRSLQDATARYLTIQSAAATVTAAQRQLARVTQSLVDASLLDPDPMGPQVCPICESSGLSLSPERTEQLLSWNPATKALDAAAEALHKQRESALRAVSQLERDAKSIVPLLPPTEELGQQMTNASQRVQGLSQSAVASAISVEEHSEQMLNAVQEIAILVQKQIPEATNVDAAIAVLHDTLNGLFQVVASHREDVAHLEEAVGAISRDDDGYRLRGRWLDVSGLITAVAEDVAWEKAKYAAKVCFDGLREGLISLRGEIIERARDVFSKEITGVWHLLRSDSGAQFSQLIIPPVRGKGYKLEFELKAIISDGDTDAEVDALRVFSESQVNVIGLAAYVTRAKLLGHKLLIFDDPVQSMDEEHFRSFAVKLLPILLDEGFQILILTHSDTFARKINDGHYNRPSYASLETRSTKRLGCRVLEGNRRISERLKNALRLAGEGDFQNAWRVVRVAIERLYTLAYARATPDFEPDTWRGLTADDMWNKGAGAVIEKAAPSAGKRLKEILSSTVAGAHDVTPTSETDLTEALKYLRSLLVPLRLGDG